MAESAPKIANGVHVYIQSDSVYLYDRFSTISTFEDNKVISYKNLDLEQHKTCLGGAVNQY